MDETLLNRINYVKEKADEYREKLLEKKTDSISEAGIAIWLSYIRHDFPQILSKDNKALIEFNKLIDASKDVDRAAKVVKLAHLKKVLDLFDKMYSAINYHE